MLRELVSADVLEGVPLEGRDDEAAASGRGTRACDPPRHGPRTPPLSHAPRLLLLVLRPPPPGASPRAAAMSFRKLVFPCRQRLKRWHASTPDVHSSQKTGL